MILRRCEGKGLCSCNQIQDIVAFIHKVSANPTLTTGVCRWGEAIVPTAILAVSLDGFGISMADGQHALLQRSIEYTNSCTIERVPYRMLELRHTLDAGGFHHKLPSYKELWSRTLLAHLPNIVFLSDDDVYSITHTLFYTTDFASHRIEFLSAHDIDRIKQMLSSLLGLYIRRQNLDLVGELLAAERCLGIISRYSVIGWQTIADAQHLDGRVDGPQLRNDEKASQEAARLFDCCYHTTLVAALAGALC